ncbi:MAG: heavy metal translocating P-type ATPase, partial [Phycisphaerales bacterium]|nr:heavy metal translocating P-type ATPase [Phycisphaerales bacterium]
MTIAALTDVAPSGRRPAPPTPATPAAPSGVACAHCGRPVPSGLVRPGEQRQFCCAGCETAWHAIRSAGLERYYQYLAADPAARPAPPRGSGRGYEEFDDPAFARLYAADDPSGLRTITLLVEGMHCAACVWLLEKLPTALPGVAEARADFGRSQLRLRFNPAVCPLSSVGRFADRLGYTLRPLRERAVREARLREDRAAVIRIGIAFALFGNAMLIAFSLYGGMLTGIENRFATLFRAVGGVLAFLSVCWPGAVFLRGAWAGLRLRTLHMDVPIALALLVGLVHGWVNTLRGSGEVYFDTLCTLVFLLLIGRWIQQRQQRRAADAVELLYSLAPANARRVGPSGELRTVPAEALVPGDTVEVEAGGSVPADGVLISGRSALNVALLTGEPRPVEVGPGDRAAAGSVNVSSVIRLRVEAAGAETRVGRLMALVAEHARRRAPIVKLADRISVVFVGVVIALAAAVFVAWLFIDPSHAAEHAVALLIITCPCALGLATPLAMVVAIGRAARAGVLIKGGEAVEALARPGTLVLDKTGTLTTGELRVVAYHGPADLRPLIARAERDCNHPIARALASAFAGEAPAEGPCTITQSLGGGIEAVVGGRTIAVGSARFVGERTAGAALPQSLALAEHSAAGQGLTPVLVAADGAPAALVVLGDQPRPEARDALDTLRGRGWRPVLLSGDDPRAARAIGAQLGIPEADCRGGASPEEKLAFVRDLAAKGTAVMVGDGVNDAAALAAATVGVAVHAGAEAAMAAADVYLASPGLTPLVELVDGAERTTAVIRRGLAVSLAYNVLFGVLAAAGMVNPLVAAVLMPISSITVVVLA